MTTSGSYTFDPTVAGLLDEAIEQAGVDPASVNERHIASAKMSLNLMFTEWAVRDGDAIYRVANTNVSVALGVSYFDLATGAIDILGNDLTMNYNTASQVEQINRISRQAYLNIPTKTTTGRPTSYYVDRTTLNAPRVYLYPVPDAACVFYYDYPRFVQTISTLAETADVERLWLAALVQGLAARMAFKYNPPKYTICKVLADESYKFARRAGSGNTSVIIRARGFGASGRTIRGLPVGTSDDTGGR